jgi:hypothetical protein
MKTPITDAAALLFYDAYAMADVARRLELDRAALMDVAQDGETLIAGDLMGAEWKAACRAYLIKARAAISAAHANFPTE